jgi:hypothetical protein
MHVMFASDVTEWSIARSVRYLLSSGGNKGDLSSLNAPARIYLSGRGEESKSVANFDLLLILDFSIRTTRHDFKKIQIGTDRGRGEVAKLLSCHAPQRYLEFLPIDPDLEVLMLRRMLMMVFLRVRWSMLVVLFMAHWNLLVIWWYHDTKTS